MFPIPPELRHPAPYEDECDWPEPRLYPEHIAVICLVAGAVAVGIGALGSWAGWW